MPRKNGAFVLTYARPAKKFLIISIIAAASNSLRWVRSSCTKARIASIIFSSFTSVRWLICKHIIPYKKNVVNKNQRLQRTLIFYRLLNYRRLMKRFLMPSRMAWKSRPLMRAAICSGTEVIASVVKISFLICWRNYDTAAKRIKFSYEYNCTIILFFRQKMKS